MVSYGPRNRTAILDSVAGGSRQTYVPPPYGWQNPQYGHAGVNEWGSCTDYVMPVPYDEDHTLSIVKNQAGPMFFTGTDVHPTNGRFRVNSAYSKPYLNERLYCPTLPSVDWGYWKTKALANMDPGKPVVDLPLFLFEFKDFPRMLRDLGRIKSGAVKPKDVPDQVLAYNFGWAPLVSDLMNLLGLQKATSDRMRYLQNLAKKKPVRRRLTPKGGSETSVTTLSDLTDSDYFIGPCFKATRTLVHSVNVWYAANAELVDPLPNDPNDLRFMSFRQVTGLTVQPERLWNFVPWTWLIDYFVNVGDYMSAWGGNTRLRCSNLCVMANPKAEVTYGPYWTRGSSLSGRLLQTTEGKLRQVYIDPTPQLSFTPFLNKTQLTNLGALITSKVLSR